MGLGLPSLKWDGNNVSVDFQASGSMRMGMGGTLNPHPCFNQSYLTFIWFVYFIRRKSSATQSKGEKSLKKPLNWLISRVYDSVNAARDSEPRDAISRLNPPGMYAASWGMWVAGTKPPTLALVITLSLPPILQWSAQVQGRWTKTQTCSFSFDCLNCCFCIFYSSQVKPTILDSEALSPKSQQIILTN